MLMSFNISSRHKCFLWFKCHYYQWWKASYFFWFNSLYTQHPRGILNFSIIFGVNSRMTLSWKTQMNYYSCFLFSTRLRYRILFERTFSQYTLTELTHLSYVIVLHHLHIRITNDICKSQFNHYLTCVLIMTKYVQECVFRLFAQVVW